jgi:hypothetical protein
MKIFQKLNVHIFLCLMLGAVVLQSCDTDPVESIITFKKNIGGSGQNYGSQSKQTSDGGYITIGTISTKGAGQSDMYLFKTDKSGNLIWEKTFGDTNTDFGSAVQPTSDGGYIVVGTRYRTTTGGGLDTYIVKTDANGNLSWERIMATTSGGGGNSVTQTPDGGYAIIGDASLNSLYSIYFIKLFANGTTAFTKTITEPSTAIGGQSIKNTSDGGFIICGSGNNSMYLLKIDANANVMWKKLITSNSGATGKDVAQTKDGGYVLIGNLTKDAAGNNDIFLVKTDATGNTSWTKSFGTTNYESGLSVAQTTDDGYILSGYANIGNNSFVQLIKTDNSGNQSWLNNTHSGRGFYAQQTTDGGYILTGFDDLGILLLKLNKDGML